MPPPEPVALLAAAVEALRRRPRRRAGRLPCRCGAGVGQRCRTRSGLECSCATAASPIDLEVYRTSPGTYRVRHGATVGRPRRRLRQRLRAAGPCAAAAATASLAVTRAPMFRIVVDGTAHQVTRDDGGVVRAGWPAFVVSVLVKPGTRSPRAHPVAVLESMKMESTVIAPFAGEVASVDVVANAQVDAGAPLAPHPGRGAGPAVAAQPARAGGPDRAGGPPSRGHATLRARLRRAAQLPPRLRPRPGRPAPAARRAAPARRDRAAGRRRPAPLRGRAARPVRRGRRALPPADRDRSPTTRSPPTARRSTCWPSCSGSTPTGPGCPTPIVDRLETALARYGVHGLERTPELDAAVVWMFRSFARVSELVPVVMSILERRLRAGAVLAPLADAEMRGRLDRLARLPRAATRRSPSWPATCGSTTSTSPCSRRSVERAYDADPSGPRPRSPPTRTARTGRRAWTRRPVSRSRCGETLLRRWLATQRPALPAVLLEVYARRFYRTRELRDLRFDSH